MGLYRLEFYADEYGDEPVRRWLREELSRAQRLVVGSAMREILEEEGIDVCGTEFGKQLGGGLFEFRVRGQLSEYVDATPLDAADEKILIRVFCHAHGDKLVLLLAGYDKLANPSKVHQNDQIALARRRLTAWRLRQAQAAKKGTKANPHGSR
ncbi:MAG: hypothetical protein WCC48_13200 [Anaeromyxobacteraceae bacterium]